MSQSLNLTLKQSLNMTMSLQQSINILQMNHAELTELISEEASKNPFLDSDEAGIQSSEMTSSKRDMDHINVSSSTNSNIDSLSFVEEKKTSFNCVLEQIQDVISGDQGKMIAFYLANQLQRNGMIDLDLESSCKELGCEESDIIEVLEKLQSLEPAGIFARNLPECLALQLKERGKYDSTFEQILMNLDLIAKHDLGKLAKITKLAPDNLKEYLSIIKSLNPKPVSLEDEGYLPSKIADVIVKIEEDNSVGVYLNSDAMPNISLNKEYYGSIKKKKLSKPDKEFITKEYYGASNLMRSINQRSKTILDVAKAIALKQKNFFLKGVMYFEPITLADIASICEINESTVSRAVNGKYIQTETGIYEMKYFFSSHISSKNSENQVSSTKVKEIIKSLVESETADNIFSDEAIASELEKFNIQIARRTVAKYREALGIEASSIRKRKAKASQFS